MHNLKSKLIIGLVVLLSTTSIGQASNPFISTGEKTQATSPAAGNQQSQPGELDLRGGDSTVVDSAKPSIRQVNSSAESVSTKAVKEPERKPFQFRMFASPAGTAFDTQSLPIPAGKRLVIENISAVARCPEGFRMEINFFCYLDNGDGVGDTADITFHRIALTDQGTFNGTATSTANHRVLVFADEVIGTAHFGLGISARLTGTATGFVQAQVTFSGYLEDLQ